MRPRPSRASISCACGSSAARASPSPGRPRASEYPLALAGAPVSRRARTLGRRALRCLGTARPRRGHGACGISVLLAPLDQRLREHLLLRGAAVLMFRFNNPDAVLPLLLVSAAWALVLGLEGGRFRWAILASVLVGLAFLTKSLQAYLVLPAFALVWLVAAHGSLRRRIARLAIAGVTTLIASGWGVVIAGSVPAA